LELNSNYYIFLIPASPGWLSVNLILAVLTVAEIKIDPPTGVELNRVEANHKLQSSFFISPLQRDHRCAATGLSGLDPRIDSQVR